MDTDRSATVRIVACATVAINGGQPSPVRDLAYSYQETDDGMLARIAQEWTVDRLPDGCVDGQTVAFTIAATTEDGGRYEATGTARVRRPGTLVAVEPVEHGIDYGTVAP